MVRWFLTACLMLAPGAVCLGQDNLPGRAQAILKKHCYECHGGKKKSAKLDVLDRGSLLERKAVLPLQAKDSELLARILARDESVMPPPCP